MVYDQSWKEFITFIIIFITNLVGGRTILMLKVWKICGGIILRTHTWLKKHVAMQTSVREFFQLSPS